MAILLRSCHCFKTVICNCSCLIFEKNVGNAIIDFKTFELFRQALKIYLEDSSENLFYNN